MNIEKLNYNERMALLYGILLGDGCLSYYKNKFGKEYFSLCITGDYYSDTPFYDSVVIPLINSLRNLKEVKYKKRKEQGKIEILFFDKILFFKLNDMGFPIGKKGKNISIPNIFYDKNLLRYVAQGFVATDGSLVLTKNPRRLYPRIEAHIIAKKLVQQLTDYFCSIGMNGHLYECRRKKSFGLGRTRQTQYRFQFNGMKNLIIFQEKIGFLNPKHKKRYLDFVTNQKN